MSSIDLNSLNDAPCFSDCMNGKEVQAKIISVYDGDTVKALFPLNNIVYKWNCRIYGVDTPEIRGSSDKEKKYAYFVRDKLREQINDKIVTFKCFDLDKYGRLLVSIKTDEIDDIGNWLIENKFAFPYFGVTNKEDWNIYLNNKLVPPDFSN